MYFGIDFIMEFLAGLVIGCLMWQKRKRLIPGWLQKRILDIRTDREREKAQERLAAIDEYRKILRERKYEQTHR
jgi:hypothetical protein